MMNTAPLAHKESTDPAAVHEYTVPVASLAKTVPENVPEYHSHPDEFVLRIYQYPESNEISKFCEPIVVPTVNPALRVPTHPVNE